MPNPVETDQARRWRERSEEANRRREQLYRDTTGGNGTLTVATCAGGGDLQVDTTMPRRPTTSTEARARRHARRVLDESALARPGEAAQIQQFSDAVDALTNASLLPLRINTEALYSAMTSEVREARTREANEVLNSGGRVPPVPVYNPDMESESHFNLRYRRWLNSPSTPVPGTTAAYQIAGEQSDTATVEHRDSVPSGLIFNDSDNQWHITEPQPSRGRVRARYGERVEHQPIQFAFNGQKVALRLAADPGSLTLLVSTPRGSYSTRIVSLLAQHPLPKLVFYRERVADRETSHGLRLMTRGETMVVMERKE